MIAVLGITVRMWALAQTARAHPGTLVGMTPDQLYALAKVRVAETRRDAENVRRSSGCEREPLFRMRRRRVRRARLWLRRGVRPSAT